MRNFPWETAGLGIYGQLRLAKDMRSREPIKCHRARVAAEGVG